MDQFSVGSIVWASARGDIFWPGEVVQSGKEAVEEPGNHLTNVTVNFFIEDSYEDIKNASKLFPWNCNKQQTFIGKGRALKNAERKVDFNKAVAKADNLFSMQEKKEDSSTSNGKDLPMKSPHGTSKRTKEKLNKSEKSEIHVLRRSPRTLMMNGHSHKSLAPSAENITENQRFKVTNNCPLLQGNGGQVICLPEELDVAERNNNGKVLTEHCHTEILCTVQSKCDDCQRCDVKQMGSSGDYSNVSASVGKKRGRRKSHQVCLKTSTAAQRQCMNSNDLSVQCNNNKGVSSQTKCPTKRKLLAEVSNKQNVPSKKMKRCERDRAENQSRLIVESNLSSNLISENMSETKELCVGVNGQSMVSDHQVTVCGIDPRCPDSGGSSDDELFVESFSPNHQESNKFSVGDIVWAKYYRDPYWPAVIKKVTEKKREKKFLVQFFCWADCLFKIQPKKLVHFACDATQRSEYKGVKMISKELQDIFEEALIEAEDFMNRKGLGKSLDDEIDEGDLQIFEEKDNESENFEKETDVNQFESLPQSSSRSLVECRKSLRERKRVSNYSNILSYIRQAKPTLKGILNGTKASERHTIYTSGRVSQKDNLKRRSGFGPIADENLRDEIMDLLKGFYNELRGTTDITYVSDVWLPEALIWSISQMDHVDRQTAEKKFRDGFEYAVSNEEVLQLTTKLKQRKPTAEKKEERLRSAERALTRHQFPVS